MIVQVKNTVDLLIESLKRNNNFFSDQIFYYDPNVESDFRGITDEYEGYAFISPVEVDAVLVPSALSPGYFFYEQQFKLISSFGQTRADVLLNFVLGSILRVKGAAPLFATCDADRIYNEETGAEWIGSGNLVRVVFKIAVPINCSLDNCLDLCSALPC